MAETLKRAGRRVNLFHVSQRASRLLLVARDATLEFTGNPKIKL
jgi:hypothetical protein